MIKKVNIKSSKNNTETKNESDVCIYVHVMQFLKIEVTTSKKKTLFTQTLRFMCKIYTYLKPLD